MRESGEIVIKTPFRSIGYINAPAEDKQRFIKNPFRKHPLEVLYHIGDRGRYSPGGSLEILGCLDEQAKSRGTRTEPDEVTIVLGEHPALQQARGIAYEVIAGDKRLVAYVVAKMGKILTVSELRRFLEHKVPEYMIPSAFVMLDSIPLTLSGLVGPLGIASS